MANANFLVTLFHAHYADLRALISYKFNKSQQDADDIVQDVFHNILRADNAETLENPKAYLYQAANNLALNRLRKHKQHQRYAAEVNAHEWREVDELTPERTVTANRDLRRLENALVKLPEKYRKTFLLSRAEEKTYKEISQQLNIAESTVEKHIIKTLKYLRDHLNDGAGL